MKRRNFLTRSAQIAGALQIPHFFPSHVLGRAGNTPPSDRIIMGCIGTGGMGTGHVRSFLGHDDVHIAAVCDVRKAHRDRAKGMVDEKYGNGNCAVYNDYRELLAREDIDAVFMAAPDHWHTLIGAEAARRGKAIYYEKPLALTIQEAKTIRRIMKQYNPVFQFGTQQRSDSRFRFACELVRNGKIGELESIMIGSANYKQIPNQPVQPVPDGLDYDLWLGPAPEKPYTFERCTRNWTLMYDYSLGCVSGAWGIHQVDIAQWANNTDHTYPVSTEGTGVFPEDGFYDTAIAWEVEHRYANGVKVIHMDMPTALKRAEQFKLHWMGVLFTGSEGWIYVCRQMIDAHPKSLLEVKFTSSEERLPVSNDHRRHFLDAVRSGQTTLSPIDAAVHSDIICHHADIAMRLNRKLDWDLDKEEFVNDVQANRMMARVMRSPWHLG